MESLETRLSALEESVTELSNSQDNFTALSKISQDSLSLFKDSYVKKIWGRRVQELEKTIRTNDKKLGLLEELFSQLPGKLIGSIESEQSKTTAELRTMAQHFESLDTQIKQAFIDQEFEVIDKSVKATDTAEAAYKQTNSIILKNIETFKDKSQQVKEMLSNLALEVNIHADRTSEELQKLQSEVQFKETKQISLEEIKHDLANQLKEAMKTRVKSFKERLIQASSKTSYQYQLKLLDLKGQLSLIENEREPVVMSEPHEAKLAKLIESARVELNQLKANAIEAFHSCEQVFERLAHQVPGSKANPSKNLQVKESLKSQIDNTRLKNKAEFMRILGQVEEAEKLSKTITLLDQSASTNQDKLQELRSLLARTKSEVEEKYIEASSTIG